MRAFLATLLLAAMSLSGQPVPGRYIVELEGEPALDLGSGRRGAALRADLETRRLLVQRRQEGMRAEIARIGGRVKGSIQVIANALIVEMSEQQAQALASRPGVRSVSPDLRMTAELDGAARNHRFYEAWDALHNGKETAGLGAKIAIFDSGIEVTHPGFQDPSLPPLEGYPKASSEDNLKLTNSKIIVMRAYAEDDAERPLAVDLNGHGTGVAMAAAGAEHIGPFGEKISGAAPKAYLGIYKITQGAGGSTLSSIFLRALDDAIADGMEIGNYSYGSPVTQEGILDGSQARALRRALASGFLLVGSAGNSGPGASTISFPAVLPEVIAVGANGNSRIRDVAFRLQGVENPYVAEPGNGPNPRSIVKGPMAAVHSVDRSGLACEALPADSLKEMIVLIQRGSCTFEVKINNAAAAGAIGVVIYNNRPNELILMNVGGATLPAMFVLQEDGEDIRARLDEDPKREAELDFTGSTVFQVTPNRMASFSSRGPIVGDSIKPDVAATGTSFLTAAQTANPGTSLFNSTGYTFTQGTSFSAPLVAGALAVLRQERPGLTSAQYRSLIVNSARALPLDLEELPVAPPQRAGSGLLDLLNSLGSTLTVFPSSLPFGARAGSVDRSADLELTNLSEDPDTFEIRVEPARGSVAPEVSSRSVDLDAGASRSIQVTLKGDNLEPGPYDGFIVIKSQKTERESRVAYWFGVPGRTAEGIGVLSSASSGPALGNVREAFLIRTTDAAGLGVDVRPQVTPPQGATVTGIRPTGSIPGTWAVDVRLGTLGTNTFTITAGSATVSVSIVAR